MTDDKLIKNWENIKPLMLSKWPKLNESDLEKTSPTTQELVKTIQKKYPDYPRESIVEDLKNLSDQVLHP